MERLDKLLAATGQWSRKEAKALVKAGRVQVGGARPKGPEDKVAEGTPVTVDGRPIATEQGVYVMLHKPAGVVSSTQDPRERTVLDLLPQHLRRRALFPVGRLDKDTEGLLLLTNDGPLAHALLAPGRHVDKVYYVEVDGRLDQQDRRAFQAGVTLADGTVYETVSDDFGDFWFKDLPETTGSVIIRAQGYQPRTFDGLDTAQCPNLGDVPLEKEQVPHCG